jgi:hypothetical protein
MGPGSVSSLLKTAIDVLFFLTWAGAVILALLSLLLLAVPLDTLAGGRNVTIPLRNGAEVTATGPMLASMIAVYAFTGFVLIFLLACLRKVFGYLAAGDPFHPDNVGRLRLIGVALIGLNVIPILARLIGRALFPDIPFDNRWFDLTGWSSILVVFVLAEVFREGARLRREAELTI